MSNFESFHDEEVADEGSDSSEDDGRTDSFDDYKVQKREKRKGLDLATTLERIEKNFVITDPRLPDNPIVSFYVCSKNVALQCVTHAIEMKKLSEGKVFIWFCRSLLLIAS